VCRQTYAKRATLDVVRLDDELRQLFPQLKGRVGVVKMDVEGGEPAVSLARGLYSPVRAQLNSKENSEHSQKPLHHLLDAIGKQQQRLPIMPSSFNGCRLLRAGWTSSAR
jgi:hypothetical protein